MKTFVLFLVTTIFYQGCRGLGSGISISSGYATAICETQQKFKSNGQLLKVPIDGSQYSHIPYQWHTSQNGDRRFTTMSCACTKPAAPVIRGPDCCKNREFGSSCNTPGMPAMTEARRGERIHSCKDGTVCFDSEHCCQNQKGKWFCCKEFHTCCSTDQKDVCCAP